MNAPHTIAVLGLGRMGRAVTERLTAQGFDVVGWNRATGSPPGGAVAEAGLVLLALFDGPACREVLDAARAELRPDSVVVNLATVAPAEAAELAQESGSRYVHAPVLGSVPAVRAGTLRILAAACDPAALNLARPALDALGTVRPVGDAATAAALKLVANHSLSGAVLALRDTLRQADALGLPRGLVLDVLELGRLGGLVAGKRAVLEGRLPPATADFTLGALAKDTDLLAAATDVPLRDVSGTGDVGRDSDIAVAALTPAVRAAVLAPLRAYVRGHATGDPAHFRAAFLPGAHIQGMREGAFVSWSLDQYCGLFPGRPAPDEAARTRRLDTVSVHGTVATATMTLRHGADTFTDVFLLVRTDPAADRWHIADKAYHRHT
ncbi:nuclear transport factor 2 family protein [Streptomyces sp. VRA16 Mangrove soil]|uniref:nuclear transport factor 2 family protein n=1 Tax=Streptomyces sp. VRA16 Mangrove soil TaxID=2817434 RepID=UPI001A9EF6B3|nr:nuclear transport factor 2 family protein [Streptomyces sp. VRA16 Mangrove soil]MBO1335435.1 nuclear transport factor 2 family protein [Streptomyces sp. VRA16 Mangrove soil]